MVKAAPFQEKKSAFSGPRFTNNSNAWVAGTLLVTRLSSRKAWKSLEKMTAWMPTDVACGWQNKSAGELPTAARSPTVFAFWTSTAYFLVLFGSSFILPSYSATLDSALDLKASPPVFCLESPPYAVIVFMAEARRYLTLRALLVLLLIYVR
ncbi:hypothetical protein AJ78_05198 [Emergomyces pasteurianus Ep9510]|uniref:Uncharacterized protein n=1 Tax=Emergomyces pasteurianus Ep9510 TaxID=1447872 RepID=A0A1J9QEA0_9EURO|nr:hypothetical protein AJ78_05198 [Emergomyces pasteurianus Ep9510]